MAGRNMMKNLILLLILGFGAGSALSAQCYLEIDNPGQYEVQAISQMSLVYISRYIESVSEIPAAGVSAETCLYKLSLTEVSEGILIAIKGPQVSAFGDSRLRGIDGFKQALFRAIISFDPQHRESICRHHYDRRILEQECSEIRAEEGQPTEPHRLVVRVPRDYRYAAIFADEELIGEMGGEVVREFEIDHNRSLRLRAEDGTFVSESIPVMSSGQISRIEFLQFNRQSSDPADTDQLEGAAITLRRTDDRKDFGEDSPVIFGLGFGRHVFDTIPDQYRDLDGKIEDATFLEAFLEYYLTVNLGIATRFINLSAERNTPEKEELKINLVLAAINLWFPTRTRNDGYSHFGLTGGTGYAVYEVKQSPANRESTDDRYLWETQGSASVLGAFYDWGGDGFGARLSYTVIETQLPDLRNKAFPRSSPQYQVDASGKTWSFNLRWAF
jgi:hypothetical protein